jgi:hypothetical protein
MPRIQASEAAPCTLPLTNCGPGAWVPARLRAACLEGEGMRLAKGRRGASPEGQPRRAREPRSPRSRPGGSRVSSGQEKRGRLARPGFSCFVLAHPRIGLPLEERRRGTSGETQGAGGFSACDHAAACGGSGRCGSPRRRGECRRLLAGSDRGGNRLRFPPKKSTRKTPKPTRFCPVS